MDKTITFEDWLRKNDISREDLVCHCANASLRLGEVLVRLGGNMLLSNKDLQPIQYAISLLYEIATTTR